MKQFAIGVLALALGLPASSPAAPAADKSASHDPIEGKWWGRAGFPTDQIEIGFEFKRNEKWEMKVYVTEPVENFYPFEAPGVLVRTGTDMSTRTGRSI